MVDISFFSDWKYCSACGLPPKKDQSSNDRHDDSTEFRKLLTCTKCRCVAYHDTTCQKSHWKAGHKRDCKEWQHALKPLKELISWNDTYSKLDNGRGNIWLQLNDEVGKRCSMVWKKSVEKWKDQEYLVALRGFQDSLAPYVGSWRMVQEVIVDKDDDGSAASFADESPLWIVKRLLFCAYCELDGNQIDSAREKLAICLTILISSPVEDDEAQRLRDDAWMELMLSMEDVPHHRMLARHVASMAIATKSCGWTDPMQRPGYMVPVSLTSSPFTPPDQHPPWCKILEQNWEKILAELSFLERTQLARWSTVGSGERGSGHDDHKVVSGEGWTEYVLFGTGAQSDNDTDAPVTKDLLRTHVPSAVSLAQQGGGEVIFSRLSPRTHIESHCGTTNLRWTAHLGLKIPSLESKCRIRVGLDWYSWQEGKILLFDDSYEHEVRNDSDEERIVLLMRFWHPDLCCGDESGREQFLRGAMERKEENVRKRYFPPN